ncbi:BQ5605_C002g01498 [Microbotryum silenes-dioicae]|uniref:BQ5605_C002g01498 protein n=1 Tax=Microbotryum silenes-dioicae TaxID=796604 RepID=A0A2X0P1S3_9BASI|nr:BQ5605_C002g01498 [Microbotryum silenes-dioicae]
MPAACNIATNSKANGKLPSRNSLQHVLFECQLSSCFFTVSWLWSRELRLTIPWQILNVLFRWGDHRVGRKSEAMPSRYSQVIPYSLQSFHEDPFRCCELEADLSRA